MQKTSVLHFRSSNFIGGPEKQILTHLNKLSISPDYCAHLASFNEPGGVALSEAAEKLAGEVGTLILAPSMLKILTNVKTLDNYIQQRQIKIVCCHDYKTELYGFILNKFYGVKTIGFSRGATAENLKMRFYSWLDFFLIRFNPKVVAVASAQKEKLLAKAISAEKITVIENAVTDAALVQQAANTESIRDTHAIGKNQLVIFSAGRLSEEKGHRFLIRAMISLLKEGHEAHLVIAGDGVLMPEFTKLIQESNTGTHIHLLGHRSDMPQLYEASNIFVLPSLSEGLPNALLESMIQSLPVIASKVGGVPEVVNDGETGLLVPAADEEQLKNALLKYIQDPDYRNTIAKQGRQSVAQRFSADTQTEKLKQLYQLLLNMH